MSITPRIRDRDPALTCRRVLLTVRAVGDKAPTKVVEWIDLVIDDNGDGDLKRIVSFARAARDGRMTALEALAVIRDTCIRRIGNVTTAGEA